MKTRDPNQLSVVFGGIPISGFALDEALSIERENPQYKNTVDLHGNHTRYRVNNDSTKITVTLTEKSYSNNILSNFMEMDRLNNSGIFPISIKEPDGTTFFARRHAYVEECPKIGYGAEEKNRVWVIQASGVTNYIGN